MSERLAEDEVNEILEGYKRDTKDSILNALGAQRKYVQDGDRVSEPSSIPDGMHYEGVSRQELEDFEKALSTVRDGYREDPINEEAMYDRIADGEVEFYVPWNVGMSQSDQEIIKSLASLQRFAENIENQTPIDASITVYTLDEYARLNNNSFQQTRKKVQDFSDPMQNIETLIWRNYEKLLSMNLNSDKLSYGQMREIESDMMSGKVRLSAGMRRDDRPFVGQTGNPKGNEAVLYGPFIGPWKSEYPEISPEIPGLVDNMRLEE